MDERYVAAIDQGTASSRCMRARGYRRWRKAVARTMDWLDDDDE